MVARLRGKNPPGEPSPRVAMILQVIAGIGLLYARRDLRRRWLYPVAVAALGFEILFVVFWLDHDFPSDIIHIEEAAVIGGLGGVVYLIGLADAYISCVIRRPRANAARS